MEKIALVVLLLGAALLSYGPVSEMFKTPTDVGSCTCPNIEDLVAQAEGKRKCVYKDSLGIPTIGIGFNLKRGDAPKLISSLGLDYNKVLSGAQCLTDAQISKLFLNDLSWAKQGGANCIPGFTSLPNCVQEVVIDMTFNMGMYSLCSWETLKADLKGKNYRAAASYIKGTLYCKQVGTRCTRNTNILTSCA